MLGFLGISICLLRQSDKPSLNFHDVEAPVAIRTLFQANGLTCPWISPHLKGKITLDARGQKVELAIGKILPQVKGTYKYIGGEFFVFLNGMDNTPWTSPISQDEKTWNLDLDRADLRESLTSFFKQSHSSYRISPDVHGTVNFQLKNASTSKVLNYMIAGNGVRISKQNGMYVVSSLVSLLNEKIAGIDLHNLDIRDAVQNLMTPYGAHIRFEKSIAGAVSLHLGACTVELALQSILLQGNYTYRLENETFVVLYRGDPDPNPFSVRGVDITSDESMDFDFDNVPLWKALKQIFKASNASYSISPDIDGKVSLHLKHTSFGEALHEVLGPLHLTFDYLAGVFVVKRSTSVDLTTEPLFKLLPPTKISGDLRQALQTVFEQAGVSYWISPDVQGNVHYAIGSARLRDVLSGLLKQTRATYWLENGAFYVGAKPKSSQELLDHRIPLVEFDQVDAKEALRDFFGRNNVDYTISDKVEGCVTLYVRQVTFKQALDYLLKQLDATYRIEGGVFKIVRN